jgi:hypothetical protein
MRQLFCIIAILTLASTAHAGDWSWDRADMAREALALGLTVVDWGQTRDIRHHNGMKELNPILGRTPSDGRANSYFATVMALHPLVTALLPREATVWGFDLKPRLAWQYLYIGVEGAAISSNWRGGLRMRF